MGNINKIIEVPQEKQGAAFGALGSLSSIAIFIGDLITANIFAYLRMTEQSLLPFDISFRYCVNDSNFPTCPGTAFYFGAFMFFIGACICFVVFYIYPPSKHSREDVLEEEAEKQLLRAADLVEKQYTLSTVN